MCSVIQDDFEVDQAGTEKRDSTGRLSTICKKCPDKAVIVLQKRHSYCKNCFLNSVTHKFRSTLGKTKLIKHNDRVLAVSYGDQSSVAMLHLIEQGMSENSHKRIKFKPILLYIDESSLWSPEIDKDSILNNVWKSLKNSFDCYVVKLSCIYADFAYANLQDVQPSHVLERDENDIKLMNNFSRITNATSKIDFILRLRYLIQTEVARKLQCFKIFTPESGSQLSVKLLSDVILGRGSQIPSDISVCDDKLKDVLILRPLREITTKEVAFYNVFYELELQAVPSIISLVNSNNSIQQVTESFICELQEEFPSTVYTVFHTGDKLKHLDNCDMDNSCIMCYNKIDSTKCPLPVSLKSASSSNGNEKSCESCSCKKKEYPQILNTLRNSLCYGCNRLVNDMGTLDILPEDVIKKAEMKLQSEEMRTRIEDFLL